MLRFLKTILNAIGHASDIWTLAGWLGWGGKITAFAAAAMTFMGTSVEGWSPMAVWLSSIAVFAVVLFICAQIINIRRGKHFEHKRAEFIRDLALPRGDEGYYTAYVNVKNTNSTEKLKDVRCEIHKLISVDSGLIYNSIVLRTKDQDGMEVNGRFKIDQDSFKEIPVFYIDQSRDDDSGVRVISADKNDIHLPHGTYLATLRCFGDEGPPDEITVCINTNTCEYVLVERPEKAQPFLDHNLIESKKP